MNKQLKTDLDFSEYLNNKDKYHPYSINIESINEELVLSEELEALLQGVEEIGFKITDLTKEIKEYMGFLAFLNIVKTKKIIPHSNIYVEVAYEGADSEEELTRFYDKMNLWNVRMVIVPKNEEVAEDYKNYISAFISKVLNKETFVSMEPAETLIKEKTNGIYCEIQGRDLEFEDVEVVKALIIDKVDFNNVRKEILASFKESQIQEIRQMINTITKSIFDIAQQDKMIKTNK